MDPKEWPMSKAIILMYHNIDKPPQDVQTPNLYVSPRMFRFQMRYLKAAGFKVVSLQNMLESVSQGQAGANLAALTFDDGFADFYINAYPVLKHYNYPSIVYVVTGLVGKDNKWDPEKEVQKPLMDWKTVAEMSRNGVQFGSHSRSHPQLTKLSGDALRDELVGSKKELEDRLGRPIDHFCYPYGDNDERVRAEVRKAGYQYAVITQRGHVEKDYDPFALRRIPIKLITNPFSFFYKIHTNSEKRKGGQY